MGHRGTMGIFRFLPRKARAQESLGGEAVVRKYRDHKYISEIEKLIPIAAHVADQVAGAKPKLGLREEWANKWDRAYHRTMNSMAKEKGLRTLSTQV